MSLITPSTKEISDNIIAQLESKFNQLIPLLPKSFLRVLSKVLAAIFILLYKYIGFMFLQIFVTTASAKETEINKNILIPLVEWGRLIGISDRTPATNAELIVDVIVNNQGGQLLAGTQLVNTDNGVTYLIIGIVLLNSPTVQATIRAASDQAGGGGSGSIGNLEINDVVSFANPLADVHQNVTVTSQITIGTDEEDVEIYRQRILDKFQRRPQGGAYADYRIWGEEVAGIVNIYPYTSSCPGHVDIYAEATPESSGNSDGIPTSVQLSAVSNSIELDEEGLATRRPVNAYVNVYPIKRTGFEITIFGIIVDNLGAVQNNLKTAIEDYLLSREPFIVGLSILPRVDRITTSGIAGIVEDIISAAGGIFTSIILKQSNVPIDIFLLDIGEKAKAETISFA